MFHVSQKTQFCGMNFYVMFVWLDSQGDFYADLSRGDSCWHFNGQALYRFLLPEFQLLRGTSYWYRELALICGFSAWCCVTTILF